jgi:hypothetical protein
LHHERLHDFDGAITSGRSRQTSELTKSDLEGNIENSP